MRYPSIKVLIVVFSLVFLSIFQTYGQSVSFELKTSPNINFDFNTINKYIHGIIAYNICELNVKVDGVQWDMYVGAETTTAGQWDVVSEYSSTGDIPPIDIVQIRINNSSRTSLIPDFFVLKDITSPSYLIGSPSAPDPAISCPDQGTNQPGDYNSSPGCYKFRVDLKITPGLDPIYRAGLYSLEIHYMLVEDL